MNKKSNIGLRVTNSFKANLELSAKKEGLSVAQYTRRKLLKNEVETINGLVLHYEAISLVKDTVVYLLDYKGQKVKPADADYILKDGKAINPINFFSGDLNPEKFEAMREAANSEKQSLEECGIVYLKNCITA